MTGSAIPDVLRRLAQQRPAPRHRFVLEQRLLADEGADVQLAVPLLDRVQPCDAVDVHEHARPDGAEPHQLEEALAACQDMGAAREQLEDLLDALRRVVLERRRLHQSCTRSGRVW